MLTGELDGANLSFRPPLSEAARNEDAADMMQRLDGGVLGLEQLGINPLDIHLGAVGDAAMYQRLAKGFVGILKRGVFADDGDGDLAVRIGDAIADAGPFGQVRRLVGQPKMAHHLGVQPLRMIGQRHLIDVVHIHAKDHRGRADVAEQSDLSALFLWKRLLGAAQQDVRLDTDRLQFLHRMLRRLCLQFAGRGDVRDQRDMQETGLLAAKFVAKLANGLEEGQRFDVTHRAADLAKNEILVIMIRLDKGLDGVGDMRNHLYGGAEIIAAALARQHVGIDPARGHIVRTSRMHAGETLVMPEVEIGLGPVIGDKHLAMLGRRHRAGIDIQIGIEFAEANLVPTCL